MWFLSIPTLFASFPRSTGPHPSFFLPALPQTFGCCRDQGISGGNCFTGTQSECTGFKDWEAGAVCGGPQCCTDYAANKSATYPACERVATNATLESSCKCTITARPCCISLSGKCEIQSKEYCDFMDGYWHDDKELCSQVDCFDSLCGLIPFAHKNRVRSLHEELVVEDGERGWE